MISLMMMSMLQDANACGGFFCNRDPIDQAAEDIVFALDPVEGEVTMHVQIAYTGTAEQFAWIVPVPANPEILLSTDQLFSLLRNATEPRFQLVPEEIGDCQGGGRYYDYALAGGYSSSPSTIADSGVDNEGTVTVVSEQQVGPYETVVLKAQSADGLLDWLQNNKYVLPDEIAKVLDPYIVANGDTHFVALRLAKDTSVGELSPLALRFPGDLASIPIQLTAIAATEDMRLRTYVLGEHRAVPESYFHVQVNDIVVDWFRGGNNWEQAISIAADEAGGHAFATDYSGPSDVLAGLLFRDGAFDTTTLADAADPIEFFERLQEQGFRGDTTMLALFRKHLPMPEALEQQGVSEQQFYNCLECFAKHLEGIAFDPVAFAADIEARVVAPLRDAQAMIDAHPRLTRLTSSVSPAEMNVDPTFVFNADMPQSVSRMRAATLETYCGNGGTWWDSPRRLVLADGRSYDLPSSEWLQERGITEYEYLSQLHTNYALVIENTSSSGASDVVYDGTDDARAAADTFNQLQGLDIVRSCGGCQHTGPSGLVWALVGLLGLGLRRRAA